MNEKPKDAPSHLRCFCGYIAATRYEMGLHLHTHLGSQWLEWKPDKTLGPRETRCFCGYKFKRVDHASVDTLAGALQSHFEANGGPVAHFLEHQLKDGK